jgi:hypothetical protein
MIKKILFGVMVYLLIGGMADLMVLSAMGPHSRDEEGMAVLTLPIWPLFVFGRLDRLRAHGF